MAKEEAIEATVTVDRAMPESGFTGEISFSKEFEVVLDQYKAHIAYARRRGSGCGAPVPQTVSMDLIAKVAGRIEEVSKGLVPAPKPLPPRPAATRRTT
jgi:hypothetical protein